jgi:hypothetical protein
MPLGRIAGVFLVVVQNELQDDDFVDDDEEEDVDEEDDESEFSDGYDYEGMLWSDDEDEEDDYGEPKRRNFLVKVGRYAEDIVPRQTGDQFREHFRLSRPTFNFLEEKLIKYLEKDNGMGPPRMGARKTMLIGIWLLANHESHRYLFTLYIFAVAYEFM